MEILLVEDNPDHAELIRRRLDSEPRPPSVTTVRSLAEARAILTRRTPDLIIVDYLLPDGAGTELLGPDGSCPIIIVTSHGDEELAVRALKDGAIDYVNKGAGGMSEIVHAIDRALREWSLRREKLEKERELRELNARLTAVLDSTGGLAIITVGEQGVIGAINRGGEQMLGRSAAELCGVRTPFDLHTETQAEELRRLAETEGLSVALDRLESQASWAYRHSDGRELPVAIRVSPIRGGTGYVLTATDISGRLEVERRVARAERYAALGRLAGGIAHDFNNILGAILALAGSTELALNNGDIAEALRNQEAIVKAGEQAGAMVERMLTFGRQEASHDGVSSVDAVLRDCLTLATPSLRSGTRPEVSIDRTLTDVRISPTSLRQVLLNLIINAGQATERSGTVQISGAEVELDEPLSCASCGHTFSGPFVELGVSDSGNGVPEPLRARIFEPFVSTREHDAGTGIGLSVVHNIVHAAGGHVTLDTGPEGSRFAVYLPKTAERAAGDQADVAASAARSHRRILFVEDEPAIQRAISSLLAKLGYEVVATSSAEEALEIFEGDPESFDLVFTDDRMPGKSGFELATELVARRPGLPIIISSGHRAVTAEDAARLGSCSLLAKPYGVKKLREALAAALKLD